MELQLTEDQELFRATTRRFLEDSCPITRVRELGETDAGFERGWWRQGAELGWTSMLVDEKAGGGSISGQGLRDLGLAAWEMGRLVSPGPLLPTNVVAAALSDALAHGASAELGAALDGILAGTTVAAFCLDEPLSPWGPDGISATVRPGTGGGLVLSGEKVPVEAGADADELLVTARAADGLVQLLVPANATGVTVRRRKGVDLVKRYASVRFDGVEVAPGRVLAGDAAAALDRQMQIAAALQLAETVGAMARVFEFTVEWAFDRHSFGRPLASYQVLKHRFADMKLWLESSNATSRAAIAAVQERRPDAGELISVAKSYVGEYGPELVQDCVQMHGGIGVTWDHDIHLYLRRVTVNAGMYGTPGDHRLRLAALSGL